MSTQGDAVRDFLNAGGAKAFSFDNLGDTVQGEITAMDVRQQTDMQTGEPLFWNNGAPRNVLVITLQTEAQDDENDDGQRTVWCRGGNYTAASGTGTSSLTAVKDAMRKANVTDLEIGGIMAMQYSGLGKASNKGFSPPKLYTCVYKAPTNNVSLDDLS